MSILVALRWRKVLRHEPARHAPCGRCQQLGVGSDPFETVETIRVLVLKKLFGTPSAVGQDSRSCTGIIGGCAPVRRRTWAAVHVIHVDGGRGRGGEDNCQLAILSSVDTSTDERMTKEFLFLFRAIFHYCNKLDEQNDKFKFSSYNAFSSVHHNRPRWRRCFPK